MSSRRALPFALTLAALALHTTHVLAAPGDEAAAEALFVEAKKLAAEGKLAEACPKFAESNRLDRGAGTLIHLADCYERNQQTASAWATFKDAASAAQALNRADWQKLATQRAAALEPKLAKLVIKVQEPAEKIEVTRDGSAMSPASWGTPLPVDVGHHVVQAWAPGRKPFKKSVAISKDGDRQEIVVPRLEDGGGNTPPPPVTPSNGATATKELSARERDTGSGQRTIGYVVGAIGIAGLALGGVTGFIAIGKNSDSKDACPTDGACTNPEAIDANDGAKTFGTISTIGFIAGGVGLATGAVLILTAPSASRSGSNGRAVPVAGTVRLVPATDGRSAGMSVLGVF